MARRAKGNQSTVEFGRELENCVVTHLKDLGYEKARISKGSGNKGELGDVAGQDLFVAECKNRNTKNVTIKEEVWRKLLNDIPLHSQRFPIYFLGNSEGRRWAVLDINEFFKLMRGYLENFGRT